MSNACVRPIRQNYMCMYVCVSFYDTVTSNMYVPGDCIAFKVVVVPYQPMCARCGVYFCIYINMYTLLLYYYYILLLLVYIYNVYYYVNTV